MLTLGLKEKPISVDAIAAHRNVMSVGFSVEAMPQVASAWATLAAILLLLTRHVLEPLLSEKQRLAFNVAVVPLLSVLAIFIIVDFLGAFP